MAVLSLAVAAAFMLFCAAANAQETCEASDHGLRADAADNSTAFTKLLADCKGRTIHIAAGTYTFAPTGYAVGFAIPTGTTLQGDGPQATVLAVAAGGTYQGFLWVRNASNVVIRGLRLEGSPYDSGCHKHFDYGHAIYVRSDSNQSAPVENVSVTGNEVHNFNGTGWIDVNASENSPGMSAVSITNNVLVSDANLAGGCAGTGLMSDVAAMISVHGPDNTPQGGLIRGTVIANNTLESAYVNKGIAVWAGTYGTTVHANLVKDTGLRLPRGPSPELGRYGIMVYNSAAHGNGQVPQQVDITDNTIQDAVSCGIYINTAGPLRITGNKISGQTDRYDGTLLKGAIALNHGMGVVLQDNELSNNYIAISSIYTTGLQMGSNNISVPPGGMRTKIR
ncbi:MAG: right-handed parallel beta-helix repeat-containing protein [Proteobacteria bacterium]|nr:right-handed parallel beta-helix repeat-containing protein [Pseudomonadota bacterium]